jgi:hypothetical protein
MNTQANRDAVKRYRLRHPDRVKAHNASPNSKAARATYEKSDNCMMYRANDAEEYEKRPERIKAKLEYRASIKGKHATRKGSRDCELRSLGITEARYQKILSRQEGRCAICGDLANGMSLCVDHNHNTGEIRGLLCHACNVGIGKFDDDPNFLRRAIKYLERF